MIGLSAKIETLKDRFAAKLFTDIASNTYTSFGRAFWLERKGEAKPEIQIASTKRYQEVLPNNKTHGHSFFLAQTGIEAGSDLIAKVGIYFSVNLDTLYPNVTERAVDYLHRDVIKIIHESRFKLTHIETDMSAFEEFGFVKEIDNMEPWYLCRFDTEIEYIINC